MSANYIKRWLTRHCQCSYCANIRKDPNYKGLRNKKVLNNAFHSCSRLRRAYGITMEQYLKQLELQENACAVCFRTVKELGRKLDVDHSHKTGEVRALLCSGCNTSLGLLRENGGTAYRLALYLQGYEVLKN